MANLREAFAGTVLANLDWDENREKAVDRVAASGMVKNQLGVWLWKAKYQLEGSAYKNAQNALLAAYNARYRDNATIAAAFVGQALREFLAPSCRACHGVGEMIVNEKRVVCETCSGSKIHRYSDMERSKTMQIGFGFTRKSAHKIAWLLGLMGKIDREVNAIMVEQLRD